LIIPIILIQNKLFESWFTKKSDLRNFNSHNLLPNLKNILEKYLINWYYPFMDKNYDSKIVEEKWQKYWEKEGTYRFDPNSSKLVFSVDTPPPYVSADHLHVGHAMSYTQAEIIIRYHRMKGKNIFYPMGFDDNGLPTERYVEKKYKIDKSKITRQEFVKLCLKETKEGGKVYEKIWRRLGLSIDWSLLYSTINPLSQRIAQRSFIDLYKKGRIYRSESPTFWCTHCQTALAQADLEDQEEDSVMYDIEFKFENGDPAIISTTRPELIPACVALYVHPKDNRYSHHIGGTAITPIFKENIPIKTSDAVEMNKGTGLMMVCTWGDIEDIEKWKIDKLETKLIINKNGKLSEKAGNYKNLTLAQARTKIVDDLQTAGHLKNTTNIKHTLNIHERCKKPIDFFASPQWFIKILDLKDDLKKRGEELNWYPSFMKVQLDNWIDGLKWDWCISRDRFFGVPFPVWHCPDCQEIILAENDELPIDPREMHPKTGICPKCGSKNIKGEMQVMDTWMTSSVSPLINAKWQDKDNLMSTLHPYTNSNILKSDQASDTSENNKKIGVGIYPMSLRVQAFEIIRTWLFYTLVKSHLHTNSLPWKNVMISGWGLAKNGEKMSKSLNNFVIAEDIIKKYSADALRYWACGATLGMNLRWSEEDVRAGQKLLTKLWNAGRFVMMNLEDYDQKTDLGINDLEISDQWILAELQELTREVTNQFEKYEFAKGKIALEQFFWIKFTDNYIELVKGRLYGTDKQKKLSAQFALSQILSTLIILYAPILPHITEELAETFNNADGSIHLGPWPTIKQKFENHDLIKKGKVILDAISRLRKTKVENVIKLSEPIESVILRTDKDSLKFIGNLTEDLKNVSHASKITFEEGLGVEIKK
jgi:valyl-tRNA synthetase